MEHFATNTGDNKNINFRCVRTDSENSLLRHVRLSVRHISTRLRLNGFASNLIFEDSKKMSTKS